jgi:hypothetical protein
LILSEKLCGKINAIVIGEAKKSQIKKLLRKYVVIGGKLD